MNLIRLKFAFIRGKLIRKRKKSYVATLVRIKVGTLEFRNLGVRVLRFEAGSFASDSKGM